MGTMSRSNCDLCLGHHLRCARRQQGDESWTSILFTFLTPVHVVPFTAIYITTVTYPHPWACKKFLCLY